MTALSRPCNRQTHLCKEWAQGTSSRGNEWREERNRICGRLVVEGHQDVAGSVCAGIPSADQQMLQGTHAVAQAKDRQVLDLRCYHWTVNAAIPFVMDLIGDAQMIESCREGCCNHLQSNTKCAAECKLGNVSLQGCLWRVICHQQQQQ